MLTAPLFPLPNVVFFPRTNLPLHIFEPRYRQLMRDALGADRRIAMGLLRPGWEKDYYGNPPVYDVCCVGYIETFEELEDGKFNLLLVGQQKVRILKVLKETPYRTVSAIPLREKIPAETETGRQEILAVAIEYFRLRRSEDLDFSALEALEYEALVNSLVAHLGLPPSHKQRLLELDDLEQRGREIARFLQSQIQEHSIIRKFQYLAPKDPSLN